MNTIILSQILETKPPKGSVCPLTSDYDTEEIALKVMDMANAVPGLVSHMAPAFINGQLKYAARLLLHDNYDRSLFEAFIKDLGDIQINMWTSDDCPYSVPKSIGLMDGK